jgi:hypothetical protein
VFTIPADIEMTFEEISTAAGHVYASGARPLAGIEDLDCSPPCGAADITSLVARVICDALGCLVYAGHLPPSEGN